MTEWKDDVTKALIELEMSEEFETRFKDANKNPYEIRKIWNDIANRLEKKDQGDQIKTKYNNLLKQFRDLKKKAMKSGAGGVSWKFYDVFLNSSTEGTKLVPGCTKDTLIPPEDGEDLGKAMLSEADSVSVSRTSGSKKFDKEIFLKESIKHREKSLELLQSLVEQGKEDKELSQRVNAMEIKLEQILEVLNSFNKK